jgi:hypothetical protein
MRSCPKCSSPTAPPPSAPSSPSIFSPEFRAHLDERDEVSSSFASDRSGPWKTEPLPGRPGWAGVFRVWEDPALGDVPRAVFEQEEDARLCAVALPLLGREEPAWLGETVGEGGFPLTVIDAERGPRVCGALAEYDPELAAGLHLLQGLVRSPVALAGVMEAAGPGALAQAGRILARRWEMGR